MKKISALICTCDRADSLVRAVRSILNSADDSFELIVMDQSAHPTSELALASMRNDPRLRYVRMSVRGKGRALNAGLRLATGDVVVCTDDDCEAPPGWVVDMARVMDAQPRSAIVFCNVVPPPYDYSAGYVPAVERDTDLLLTSIVQARDGFGLGAGMALRRQAVLDMGGFDETFGPGGRFASGDDWDIALRAMLKGWHIYHSSSIAILHHGFRTMEEGKTHALRDWIAIGALCAKPVKAGHLSVTKLIASLFIGQALWPPLRAVLRLKRPSGLSRIKGFIRGFAGGLQTPVDRQTLVFQPRA